MSILTAIPTDNTSKLGAVHQPGTRKKLENYSYPLDDIIGKGYSSQVFKGRNDVTSEPVAIKVIDMKMLKNDLNKMLLTSEIDNLKRLKNTQHILQLYEIFTTKNNTYLITELCDGDLSSKIKNKLTQSEVLVYMSQLIQGYKQVYKNHIIHRDLKPANILMKGDQLKIADFGFSIKQRQSKNNNKYNVGSPLYMPPQSLKRNEYSYESDIWALGIICYEMLYSRTPWNAKSEKQLIKRIESNHIQTLISPTTHPMLSEFIVRCLQCNKAERLSPEDLYMFEFQTINIKAEIPIFRSTCSSPLEIKDINVLKEKNSNSHKDASNSINTCGRKTTIDIQLRSMDTENAPVYLPSQINKEQRKHVSKLLLSEIHFCRFLFKFVQRIRDHLDISVWQQLVGHFASVVMFKINKVRSIQYDNFINTKFYTQYKTTADYEKIIKITEQYFVRYSNELETDCIGISYNASQAIFVIRKFISSLYKDLKERVTPDNIQAITQQVIVLDYLITAYQLFELIKDGENYQLFARKSKIEEIVEGQPNKVNMNHFSKICKKFYDLKM